MAKCTDAFRGVRCDLPAGHVGLHGNGGRTWGFRNVPEPEWVRRARERSLPAKDMTAAQ